MRTRSTSTHGDFAAARSASMLWHRDFVPRNLLQRFGHVRVAAIRISRIEKAQPVIVTIAKQVGEPLEAERGLVRVVATADRARAHRQPAGLDSRLSQHNCIGSAELSRKPRKSRRAIRECGRMKPGSSGRAGCAMQKLAAFHGTSAPGGIGTSIYHGRGKGSSGIRDETVWHRIKEGSAYPDPLQFQSSSQTSSMISSPLPQLRRKASAALPPARNR
jgi:hypothetical protein